MCHVAKLQNGRTRPNDALRSILGGIYTGSSTALLGLIVYFAFVLIHGHRTGKATHPVRSAHSQFLCRRVSTKVGDHLGIRGVVVHRHLFVPIRPPCSIKDWEAGGQWLDVRVHSGPRRRNAATTLTSVPILGSAARHLNAPPSCTAKIPIHRPDPRLRRLPSPAAFVRPVCVTGARRQVCRSLKAPLLSFHKTS